MVGRGTTAMRFYDGGERLGSVKKSASACGNL